MALITAWRFSLSSSHFSLNQGPGAGVNQIGSASIWKKKENTNSLQTMYTITINGLQVLKDNTELVITFAFYFTKYPEMKILPQLNMSSVHKWTAKRIWYL